MAEGSTWRKNRNILEGFLLLNVDEDEDAAAPSRATRPFDPTMQAMAGAFRLSHAVLLTPDGPDGGLTVAAAYNLSVAETADLRLPEAPGGPVGSRGWVRSSA